MSGAGRGSVRPPFAERFGIDRRKAGIAAAVVGGVFLIALAVTSQRIRERQSARAESAESAAAVAPAETETGSARAPWADPREARRLAGDSIPDAAPAVDAGSGETFVPLGHDVGPGTYGDAARGTLGDPPAGAEPVMTPAPGSAPGAEVVRDTVQSPAERRLAAFRSAVTSRRLRGGTRANSDSVPGSEPGWQSGLPAVRDTAVHTPPLPPYGRAQVEEDRSAAERAARQLGPVTSATPPPADAAMAGGTTGVARFVSAGARPCRLGERVIAAGYAIPATLVSEVNSEVPGSVVARTGRDVYDPRLLCVVLPAGSLLVGRYETGLAVGGERLVIVWEQVRLADGRAWMLPALPIADRLGAPGIAGRVDRRTRQTLESAALLSALGAAIEYATPGGGQVAPANPQGYPASPSPRDRAVGAATQPLRSAADRLLDRAVEAKPVLHVRAGQPITVVVPRDVDLDHPAPAAPGSAGPSSRPGTEAG